MGCLEQVSGRAEDLVTTVRREVLAIDPKLPLTNVRTMDQVIAERHSRERLATALLGSFSLIALVLAAIGVYGVISYGVAQRTSEIGVRAALGARATDIVRLVMRDGVVLVGVGVLIIAAVGATAIPSWRAARVDPLSALRQE